MISKKTKERLKLFAEAHPHAWKHWTKDIIKKADWVFSLSEGDKVHTCRGKVEEIVYLYGGDEFDPYDVSLEFEDGISCSAMHCCSKPVRFICWQSFLKAVKNLFGMLVGSLTARQNQIK